MRELIAEGKSDSVVDVDGSYFYNKYQFLANSGANVNPLGPPPEPPHGWLPVPLSRSPDPHPFLSRLPSVTAGKYCCIQYSYIQIQLRSGIHLPGWPYWL